MPAAAAGVSGGGVGEQRALPGNAGDVGAGEEQHREQQVGDRPGGDDRDALPDALPVEGARQVAPAATSPSRSSTIFT